ncbi:UNVERIFIED_CONTAM: hypothetical protein FKN15_050970 [Acipenser sinensis]
MLEKKLSLMDNFEHRLAFFKEPNLLNSLSNIDSLFRLFHTIPMSSAACERNFSCLRRLKNYMRNTRAADNYSYQVHCRIQWPSGNDRSRDKSKKKKAYLMNSHTWTWYQITGRS